MFMKSLRIRLHLENILVSVSSYALCWDIAEQKIASFFENYGYILIILKLGLPAGHGRAATFQSRSVFLIVGVEYRIKRSPKVPEIPSMLEKSKDCK